MAAKATTAHKRPNESASAPPATRKCKFTAPPDATPVKKLPPYPVELVSCKDLAARLAFLHLFGGIPEALLASMFGVDVDTLHKLTRSPKTRLRKFPRGPTTEELAELHSIRIAIATLAGMPPPPPPPPLATVSETLQFPMPQESRKHLDRSVSVIGEVKTSLSICMYVFSHEELIDAVIEAKQAFERQTSCGAVHNKVFDRRALALSTHQVSLLIPSFMPATEATTRFIVLLGLQTNQ